MTTFQFCLVLLAAVAAAALIFAAVVAFFLWLDVHEQKTAADDYHDGFVAGHAAGGVDMLIRLERERRDAEKAAIQLRIATENPSQKPDLRIV